jgi:hypothetical protein
MAWGEVELEPEVRDWPEGLDDQRWAQAMFHLDLLEERGVLLGEPVKYAHVLPQVMIDAADRISQALWGQS